MSTLNDYQSEGTNADALFTLKLHRGDGMLLLAMNWKNGPPPKDFVGFAIEYKEPDGDRFFALKNRLGFLDEKGKVNPKSLSTRLSPIQKFRWVHFPRNAELPGLFKYRVTPVFMNTLDELSYGEPQTADIQLMRETFPGKLNIAFTRGYVSSQAFNDRYLSNGEQMETLLPADSKDGLTFESTHPKGEDALSWMGFEARVVILDVLDKAIADPSCRVDVIAYDLCERVFVEKLEALGDRLRVIIDDDGTHGEVDSGETQAEEILRESAGEENVLRQHMGKLQHNKMIVVYGDNIHVAIGGSCNFSWRGFFVQNNNSVIVSGDAQIQPFKQAFEHYWENKNSASVFGGTASASLIKIPFEDIDVQVTFSPHGNENEMLDLIADDVARTESTLFFSMAFLYQTKGRVRDAFKTIAENDKIFSFGMSDKLVKTKGKDGEPDTIDFLKPDGTHTLVNPSALNKKSTPEPFKSEATGGNGVRLHHKFVVIDFDKPSARVYMGSYNFSKAADTINGENLFLIKDRRVATSYMIEAMRIFDHYQFRLAQADAKKKQKQLHLAKPPLRSNGKAWWYEYFTEPRKIKDRDVFS